MLSIQLRSCAVHACTKPRNARTCSAIHIQRMGVKTCIAASESLSFMHAQVIMSNINQIVLCDKR